MTIAEKEIQHSMQAQIHARVVASYKNGSKKGKGMDVSRDDDDDMCISARVWA